jgi:hypothetical protein
MTEQHTPTPDSATIRDLSHTAPGPTDDFGNQERVIHPGRAAECLICNIGLSDRLADERSASKSPNSSDPADIAGARERLNWALRPDAGNHVGGDHDKSVCDKADLRTILADHARLEAENAELKMAVESFLTIHRALTNRAGQDNG